MKRGDRIEIIRGAYHGNQAEVLGKVCGTNDAWFCRIPGLDGKCMVFETEIRHGKEE